MACPFTAPLFFHSETSLSPPTSSPTPTLKNSSPHLQPPKKRASGKGKRRGWGDLEKELQSAKKNSESNLVNQLLGFLSSQERSQPIVDRAIGQLGKSLAQVQQLRPIFYNTVRMVNLRRGRKYVNSSSLLACSRPAQLAAFLPQLQDKLAETGLITMEELCLVFRKACFQLVRECSISAILTSRRITAGARAEHLVRRRRVEGNLLR